MSFRRPNLPETPTTTGIIVRYHMGIIGFPIAFQHDTTKSSQWGQTLFEGPFKYYEIFSKCRRIQKHPVMVKKNIVRLHISFGPIVLHI